MQGAILQPWGGQVFLRKDTEDNRHIQQKQQHCNGKLQFIKIKKSCKLETPLAKKKKKNAVMHKMSGMFLTRIAN